jgi:hypothetical protein
VKDENQAQRPRRQASCQKESSILAQQLQHDENIAR